MQVGGGALRMQVGGGCLVHAGGCLMHACWGGGCLVHAGGYLVMTNTHDKGCCQQADYLRSHILVY